MSVEVASCVINRQTSCIQSLLIGVAVWEIVRKLYTQGFPAMGHRSHVGRYRTELCCERPLLCNFLLTCVLPNERRLTHKTAVGCLLKDPEQTMAGGRGGVF